jgi:site-specific DNA-methyltransferase (adenine-specific)
LPPPHDLGGLALDDVHHGDALALLQRLPDASVDMLLTDPPYSSGGFTRSDRMADPAAKYEQSTVAVSRVSFSGDNRDQRAWHYWMALWLSECLRIVKPGGKAAVFSDWRQMPTATDALQAGGFVWRGIFAWDKGPAARAPHTGYLRHQAEFLVWGSNGPMPAAEHGGPWNGCETVTVDRSDKHHLTGKPTELMRRLVRVCPPGGVILDPFAGSGTTIVAAVQEGRRGLGFELASGNVVIARERLAATRASIVYKPGSTQAGLFAP